MARSQDALAQASKQIREVLLPAGRLIENAKREIDLQVHELSLLSSFERTRRDLDPQQRTLLRLSPSVQSLLNLHASPLFPQSLSQLFQPWTLSARAYQQRVPAFQSFDDAAQALVDLRARTHILQRAIDRELSVQLIHVTESSQKNMAYWALALALAFVASTLFAYLVWHWMEPLTKLRKHLSEHTSRDSAAPFPSFTASGLKAPPAEVLELSEAMRTHVLDALKQKNELTEREGKLQEADRSLSTLFAAISHLLRHNETLIEELVKKERLASMSEMAAQLAHELKNPLNSMSLKLELLREDLDETQKKILDRVLDEIDRLDALTESHLSQTRGGLRGQLPVLLTEQGESVISHLFDEIRELHAAPLKQKEIQLEAELEDNFRLPVPKSVMKSALVNLLKNSDEAFDGVTRSSKVIRIEQDGESSSDWRLLVMDNGCGFPEEFKPNPFQMFRTSKSTGSGLGLVTTQKMLEAYGIRMSLIEAPAPFVTCWCLEPDSQLQASSDETPKEQSV